MTTAKKNTSSLSKMIVPLILVILAALCAAVFFAAKAANKNSAKSSAIHIVQTIFSCTQQQATEFDALLLNGQSTDSEVGLTSGSDAGLTDHLTTQYGDLLTPDCLAQCMANRTFSQSMAMAKDHQCGITATEIEVKEHTDTPGVFGFSAVLVDASNQTRIAALSGTICMEETESQGTAKKWMATNIKLI